MTTCFEASGLMQLLKIRTYTHTHMAFCCFSLFYLLQVPVIACDNGLS